MDCRMSELRNKEVVCIRKGELLGCVNDVLFDTCTAQITAIIIYGKGKLFGLLGREDDCVICWDEIKVIGKDILLVDCVEQRREKHKRRSLLDSLLGSN